MKVELTTNEIVYNFNTDFDDLDNSYCFVLMGTTNSIGYQILINYSQNLISILMMRSNGASLSVDHNVSPYSIKLSDREISSPYELAKAIDELLSSYGKSRADLHSYISQNLMKFLSYLLQDAQNRGLIDKSSTITQSSNSSGCCIIGLMIILPFFII